MGLKIQKNYSFVHCSHWLEKCLFCWAVTRNRVCQIIKRGNFRESKFFVPAACWEENDGIFYSRHYFIQRHRLFGSIHFWQNWISHLIQSKSKKRRKTIKVNDILSRKENSLVWSSFQCLSLKMPDIWMTKFNYWGQKGTQMIGGWLVKVSSFFSKNFSILNLPWKSCCKESIASSGFMTLIDVKTCRRKCKKRIWTWREIYFKMKLGNVLFVFTSHVIFSFCKCKPAGSDIESQLQQVNFYKSICKRHKIFFLNLYLLVMSFNYLQTKLKKGSAEEKDLRHYRNGK